MTGAKGGLMSGFGLLTGGFLAGGLAGGLSAASAPKINPYSAAQNAFTNSFGEQGDVAARRAQDAYNNLGNTAGARLSANNLNMLGAGALGGIQSTTDSASQMAGMNFGNTRRNAFDMVRMSGGGPAAIAGIASKLGEANTQTVGNLAGQSSDALARAMGIASNNYGSAQNILQNDLSTQHSIAHDQLADFNPALFQANIDKQKEPSFWQGVGSGVATGLGSLSSRMLGGSMSSIMSQDAMSQAQRSVFTPDKWQDFAPGQGFPSSIWGSNETNYG